MYLNLCSPAFPPFYENNFVKADFTLPKKLK